MAESDTAVSPAPRGSVHGSIDGFEGLYLTGWAIADPDDHAVVVEIHDEAGHIVASARATRARADLAALGYGRTTFAFRIPLERVAAAGLFRVTADGQELPGSPVAAGPGHFDGFIEIANGHLDGWVTERAAHRPPPDIELRDADGILLARGSAQPPAADADPNFAPAHIYLPIPNGCIGREAAPVDVFANGVQVGRRLHVRLALSGKLASLNGTRCTGWLGAEAAPARRFAIEVWRDGVLVGHSLADETHQDPTAPKGWDVGFDIELAPPPPGTEPHSVSIRLAGSTTELLGGPFLVGDRAAFVATARRAAATLVHSDLPGLDPAVRSVLQAALAEYAAFHRHGPAVQRLPQPATTPGATRLTVLVPVYRGVEVTRACLDSILAVRDPARDTLLVVNDASPEPAMAGLLASYCAHPRVIIIENPENLGFVGSVNRGFDVALGGDVLLLNSDTRLFPGALDELHAIAHGAPDIGTVTALSNSATIFTYPEPEQPLESLADATWEELAAVALAANRGRTADVPTGHGFCMLIRRDVLLRTGCFNPVFGRGYGEENEFCQRAADLGYRHVAAAAVLVEHRERVSFGAEREALLSANLARLAAAYPEYNDAVRRFLEADPLCGARWALHAHRLRKARAAHPAAILVVGNQLGGGTLRSEQDIATGIGYGDALVLRLSNTQLGGIELASPLFTASITGAALPSVLALLDGLDIGLVLIHHLLGFDADATVAIAAFSRARRSIVYAHDFYVACPRVTLIDAVGAFCGGAPPARCDRCLALGGPHEASRIAGLDAAAHRALFTGILGAAEAVAVPSADTATRLGALVPGLAPRVLPHPDFGTPYPTAPRAGGDTDILLLGAIGPHKGSAELLRLARHARLTHPALRFHVIGYTDIDDALEQVGNVTITGKYAADELPGRISDTAGRLALFLHVWPETFSYTLSEAVAQGLIPVVPDLGAPAERVRTSGFGVVFPSPFDPATVLETLDAIAAGQMGFDAKGHGPAGHALPGAATAIAAMLMGEPPPAKQKRAKARSASG